MTLTQLRDRLNVVLAERPALGDLPVAVELPAYGPLRKNGRRSYKHDFRAIESASSVIYGGILGNQNCAVITAETITAPERKKA